MNKFYFTLVLLMAFVFANNVYAQCPIPTVGEIANEEAGYNPECETGGGGGSGPTITGGLFYKNYAANNWGDIFWLGYEDNGPNFTSNEVVIGKPFFSNQTLYYDCTQESQADNDEARSAVFYGNVSGKTFIFYDNSGGSESDDYCVIYFKKALPAQYAYGVYTFENSYQDEYVSVTYHSVNGLDGKVSLVRAY